MHRHLAVAGLVLASANLLLHATGLNLLRILRKSALKGSQTTLIMHLSLTELLISMTHVIKHVATLGKGSEGHGWTTAYEYASVAEYAGLNISYYLAMAYITLFRCGKILLGFKYSNYWSDRKTNNLCVITSMAAIAICSAIGILKYLYNIDYKYAFFTFVFPSADAAFLILAIIAYTAIFRKHQKSSRRLCSIRDIQGLSQSKRKTTGKFWVPKLLVLTFILFMIVPDITSLVYFIIMQRQSDVLQTVITIMYTLSLTSDGVIYIFFQGIVRRRLFKQLHFFEARSDSTATESNVFYVNSQRKRSVPTRVNEHVADLQQ